MTGWYPVLGVLGGLCAAWILLVALLWRAHPGRAGIGEAVRPGPDVLRLLRRLGGLPPHDTSPR